MLISAAGGFISAATITREGSTTDYVPGSDLLCNTKSIDVIADLQPLPKFLVGPINLISDELTPNLPYSEPVKNSFIGFDEVINPRIGRFDTLEVAQHECFKNADCTGVTKETDGLAKPFSIRKGGLIQSRTKETSWAKIKNLPDKPDYALPWIINISEQGDWIISK
jgi:hypothetical protein